MTGRFVCILLLIAYVLPPTVAGQAPTVDDYVAPPYAEYGSQVVILANVSDDSDINATFLEVIYPNATIVNHSMTLHATFTPTSWRYRRVYPDLPLGATNFTIYVNDSDGNYNADKPSFLLRIYQIPSPNPYPRVDDYAASDTISGNAVTLEVNASDYLYVANVTAQIHHPNGSVGNYSMPLVEELNRTQNRFTTSIAGLGVGEHNVTFILATLDGRTDNDTTTYFEVYTTSTFTGDVIDAAGNPIDTTFNFYRDSDSSNLIHTVQTDGSGSYSASIRQRIYDLGIHFDSATVVLDNVNVTGQSDVIDLDLVSRGETDLVNDMKGFGVDTVLTEPGYVTFNYSQSEVVENEDDLTIFYCANWTFASRTCASDWEALATAVNKVQNYVNASFTEFSQGGESAFMVAEGANPYKWTVSPASIDETVYLGTNGTLATVNITNHGYYDILYNLSIQGPASNFRYLWLSSNSISVIGNRTESVTVYYESPDQEEYYPEIGEVRVRPLNVPVSAEEYATSKTVPVNLNVIREDIIPPSIVLRSPDNGSSIVAGTILDFDIVELNLSTASYRINNGASQTLSTPYDIDTAGFPDGTFTVRIDATDRSGNAANKTFQFTVDSTLVDSTPPTISLNGPSNLSVILPGTVIDLSVSDPNLVNANYSVNAGPAIDFQYPYDIDTAGYADGTTTIVVTASDGRGNTATYTLVYVVDSTVIDFTPPAITLASPVNNTQIPIGTALNYSVSDDHLAGVTYTINSLEAQTLPPPYDIDTADWSEGTYTINVTARDANGNNLTKHYRFTLIQTNVSLYISPIAIDDINPGETVTAAVTVSSETTVDTVELAITLPSGATVTYPMLGVGDLYSISIAGFTTLGDYYVTVSANNTGGDSASRSTCFEVYQQRTFTGDVLDVNGQPIATTFTLARYGCHETPQTFATNASGDYNASVRTRPYNLTIDALTAEIILYDIDFSTLPDDPLDLEELKGINLYIENMSGLAGYGVNHTIPVSTGRVTLSYDEDDIENNENFVILLECDDWDWSNRSCAGNFTQVSTAVRDIYTNTVRADITNLTTLFLAESIACGDGTCQLTYGENCYTCPDDCGLCETNVSVNITFNETPRGGGGGRVDLDPIEELLEQINNNLTAMDQRMSLIEQYLLGLNASVSPYIVEQISSMLSDQSQKLDLIYLSQQISSLIYGAQIVSAELYPGEYTQTQIHLKNSLNRTIDLNVTVSGGVADFVTPELTNFTLGPSEEIDITIIVYPPPGTQPGTYYGEITVAGDELLARIPVNIRVLSPLKKLLDFEIQLVSDVVRPGGEIRAEEIFYNLGEVGQMEVTAVLELLAEDNTVVARRQDTALVETSQNIIRSLDVPAGAREGGRYVVRGTAYYEGLDNETLRTTAVAYVTIQTPLLFQRFFGIPLWAILAAILIPLAAYGLLLYHRKRVAARRRYLETIDFKKLPAPTDRSGFIGRIAETDVRAFLHLDDLSTHTLVAGATGGGKTIAAQDIVEEGLAKDVAAIVFDPTAQWTGFLRPNTDKSMLRFYGDFGMKESEARAFDGNIITVSDPTQPLNLKRYMNPGEITVVCLNELDPDQIDVFVENTVKTVFKAGLEESQQLKLILVYDEVHRLLPKFGGSGRGFTQIERAAREFRKWGIGLVLISQVLSDFVGEIKANIGTEIQMRTRYERDLERIKMKYGEDILKSIIKADVGTGMMQNSQYNNGRPYFVSFRPIYHNVERLSDEEIKNYDKYNSRLTRLADEVAELKQKDVDVFDLELELKLSADNLKKGSFDVVEMYLETLEPRIEELYDKEIGDLKPREPDIVSSMKDRRKKRRDVWDKLLEEK